MAEGYTMKKHPLSNRLTPQQETAIDLIIAGQTDREVAQRSANRDPQSTSGGTTIRCLWQR